MDIKKLIEDADVGATVVLHTPGYAEYFIKIDPSYSCAKVDGDQIRIVAKAADFKNQEDQARKIADTANMFSLLATGSFQYASTCKQSLDMIKKHVQVIETGLGHTSQTELDN